MKQIDETAGRMGAALRRARCRFYMNPEETSVLLHISPNELNDYERGIDTHYLAT